MLLDAFEHDMRMDVFGENDSRIASNHMLIRERVAPVISASHAPVVVMKPILDSFIVCDVLREHPTARVIWALRGFEPVIASALKKFGSSVADEMREVVVHDRGNGWLKRGLPKDTLHTLRALNVADLGPNEWMALVWWSVNRTLLLPELAGNDRLLLVSYEDLIREPEGGMRTIYSFIGLPFRRNAIDWIDPLSATRHIHLNLNPEIRQLCDELVASIGRTLESTNVLGAHKRSS